MDKKKPVRIVHQDVEDTNYIMVIEIHNDADKYDAVYRVFLPDYFQEFKEIYKIYNFVHN